MSTHTLRKSYRCSDDCLQSGCPTHIAKLTYQSTSDTYTFDDGKGHIHHFERGALEAFILLMKDLNEDRWDSYQVIQLSDIQDR